MTPFDAELSGYAEARFTYQAGVDGTPWGVVERVRPRFTIAPTERMSAEVVVEGALAQGRDTAGVLVDEILASDLGPVLESANCSFYDPTTRYGSTAGYLSVERLHLDVNLPAVDLKFGRQPIRWGSGIVFHPTDLYAEVLLQEPWREVRGIDAVRADVPIGASQITGVVAVDDNLGPLYQDPIEAPLVSGAMRATLRAANTDWSAVGQVKSDGNWFAGADLRGTLGVGWWVEGGWRSTEELSLLGSLEVVAGIDYSFPVLNRFYLAAEYRYDGTGTSPDEYDFSSRYAGSASPIACDFLAGSGEEARTTLGIHYVDQITSIQFTQDFGVTNSVLVNLLDGTGLLVPDVFLNVGTHVALHATAQVPFGTDGEFRPAPGDLAYTVGTTSADLSGIYPDASLFGWVRYSF
jgi:hypothetical protein